MQAKLIRGPSSLLLTTVSRCYETTVQSWTASIILIVSWTRPALSESIVGHPAIELSLKKKWHLWLWHLYTIEERQSCKKTYQCRNIQTFLTKWKKYTPSIVYCTWQNLTTLKEIPLQECFSRTSLFCPAKLLDVFVLEDEEPLLQLANLQGRLPFFGISFKIQ